MRMEDARGLGAAAGGDVGGGGWREVPVMDGIPASAALVRRGLGMEGRMADLIARLRRTNIGGVGMKAAKQGAEGAAKQGAEAAGLSGKRRKVPSHLINQGTDMGLDGETVRALHRTCTAMHDGTRELMREALHGMEGTQGVALEIIRKASMGSASVLSRVRSLRGLTVDTGVPDIPVTVNSPIDTPPNNARSGDEVDPRCGLSDYDESFLEQISGEAPYYISAADNSAAEVQYYQHQQRNLLLNTYPWDPSTPLDSSSPFPGCMRPLLVENMFDGMYNNWYISACQWICGNANARGLYFTEILAEPHEISSDYCAQSHDGARDGREVTKVLDDYSAFDIGSVGALQEGVIMFEIWADDWLGQETDKEIRNKVYDKYKYMCFRHSPKKWIPAARGPMTKRTFVPVPSIALRQYSDTTFSEVRQMTSPLCSDPNSILSISMF